MRAMIEEVEALRYAEDGSNVKDVEAFCDGEYMQGDQGSEGYYTEYAGVSFDDGRGKDDAFAEPGAWLVKYPDDSITIHGSDPTVEVVEEWGLHRDVTSVMASRSAVEAEIARQRKRKPPYRIQGQSVRRRLVTPWTPVDPKTGETT